MQLLGETEHVRQVLWQGWHVLLSTSIDIFPHWLTQLLFRRISPPVHDVQVLGVAVHVAQGSAQGSHLRVLGLAIVVPLGQDSTHWLLGDR